jgi:hypothetical protein
MTACFGPAATSVTATAAVALCLASGLARAEDSGGLAAEPNPYYFGASQALTRDSNVFRIPAGPADTYSSTSLLGGFDQSISRQRVFGDATVSANRYFGESTLNNTSYDIRAGASGSTVDKLSGGISADFGQQLTAQVASASAPQQEANLARTQNIVGNVNWGTNSLITLQGDVGYSKIDYSLPASAVSNATESRAGLSVLYWPGASLKVGLGARFVRRQTPNAFDGVPGVDDPANDVHARTLSFLFDYNRGGSLRASGEVGYTKQTNSNPVAEASDFSGFTGSLDLDYVLTGKTSADLLVSRNASLGDTLQSVVPPGTTSGGGGPTTGPVPAFAFYQNSEIINALALGINYAATGKVTARLGARYARETLLATAANTNGGNVDVFKTAYLNVNYTITRSWSAACQYTHESRDSPSGTDFSYVSNAIGCLAQFTLR